MPSTLRSTLDIFNPLSTHKNAESSYCKLCLHFIGQRSLALVHRANK